jgi:hypothetical protein
MTKDEEVRKVVAELDAQLAQLRKVTEALTAVLAPPQHPGGTQEKEPVT